VATIERSCLSRIRDDLRSKIVLVTGPRQSGKTTLARSITEDHEYVNFDYAPHRLILKDRSWDRKKRLVVLDELHKMRGWKSGLKGVYDVEGVPPGLLVTGSARLETARKGAESLAGRFFLHRLHPFDVKEVQAAVEPEAALERIVSVGGFPEPFLRGDQAFYGRWKQSHTDMILRQDLLDLEAVRDVVAIETLVEMLRSRVGSTVSYASLARDLERDAKTVKRWLGILENLYVVFPIRPYHRNVARSLLKEPKYYFFDCGQVQGDAGARLENACACALLKELHRAADEDGRSPSLHYLRDKEGREVDFAVLERGRPPLLVEVRHADDAPSPALSHFASYLPGCSRVQVVRELGREKTYPDGTEVRRAAGWLAELGL
jgi:predicted AAA+ superfamily ATPase